MTHLMVQIGSSGKARCAERCGHRASAATRPAGRYDPPEAGFSGLPDSAAASLMMPGITALGAPCRKAGKPGEMCQYYLPLVLSRSILNLLILALFAQTSIRCKVLDNRANAIQTKPSPPFYGTKHLVQQNRSFSPPHAFFGSAVWRHPPALPLRTRGAPIQ